MSIITKEIKIYFYSNFNNEKIEFNLSKLYSETTEDGKKVYLNTIHVANSTTNIVSWIYFK